MTANIGKIRLGQCDVTYMSQNLGFTKGGVEVTIKNDVTETTIDEYGTAPAKTFYKGTRIEVKAMLSEYQFEALQKVINGAQLVEGDETNAVTIGEFGGAPLAGGLLVLHPTLVSGTAQDVQVYKAVSIGDTRLPFKVDGETVYEALFVALVDESKSDGNLLARFGIVA